MKHSELAVSIVPPTAFRTTYHVYLSNCAKKVAYSLNLTLYYDLKFQVYKCLRIKRTSASLNVTKQKLTSDISLIDYLWPKIYVNIHL